MTDADETISESFARMHKGLADPELREERARETARKQHIEDRKADTGAYA